MVPAGGQTTGADRKAAVSLVEHWAAVRRGQRSAGEYRSVADRPLTLTPSPATGTPFPAAAAPAEPAGAGSRPLISGAVTRCREGMARVGQTARFRTGLLGGEGRLGRAAALVDTAGSGGPT